MTFVSNTSKNEYILEDGTIAPSVEEHLVLVIIMDSRLNSHSHLQNYPKRSQIN